MNAALPLLTSLEEVGAKIQLSRQALYVVCVYMYRCISELL